MDNLKLIALRVGDMGSGTSNIRKSLKSNTDYYFYQGYKINNKNIIEVKDGDDSPAAAIYSQPKEKVDYDDYPNLTERNLNINICAIVGENGCGKSALIEIMMRIINNFACYLLGEYRSSWAAENLLYVEGVRASLFYLGTKKTIVNNENKDVEYCFKLEVYDRSVKLYENGKELKYLFDEEGDINKPLECTLGRIGKLSHFFYTIVNNYSIYAYNTNDFWNENAHKERIEIINKKAKDTFFSNQLVRIEQIRAKIREVESQETSELKDLALQFLEHRIKQLEPKLEEERSWLAGLFHKNDGYTAPMVITPFRSYGDMDINNESFLAKSRLLSLISSGIIKEINKKPIHRIDLNWYEDKCFSSYKKAFERVGLGEISKEKVDEYSYHILLNYDRDEFFKLLDHKDDGVQYALKYLVYKTLKISRNYSNHDVLYSVLSSKISTKSEIGVAISQAVADIMLDSSHITLKIRQILSYLRRRQYECTSYYMKNNETNHEDSLFFENCISEYYGDDIAEVLPPPIFDTTIVLRDKNNGEDIAFNTLSSGERQSSYFTSSVVYHLRNLDSAEEGNGKGDRVEYGSACLVFEEIELYFHPEMQRKLIASLIDMIKEARLRHLKSVQMIFVTHSPFILSDIPHKNCMFLKDGNVIESKPNDVEMKTYGANIYDMLRSSFFLKDGAIGEYAKTRINSLIHKINYVHFSHKRDEAVANKRSTGMIDVYLEEIKYLEHDYPNSKSIEKDIVEDLRKNAESEIEIIDEPIIKAKLTEMLKSLNIGCRCGN